MDKKLESSETVDKELFNPDELLAFCQKERRLMKVVSSDVQFNHNLVVKDISLVSKGDGEDKAFGENHILHKNVRRGNSILEVLNDQKKVGERIIVRKGLKKFFDVYLEYLDLDVESTVSTWVNKNKHFSQLKLLTIDPVQDVFDKNEGNDIHIYKLGKANGENAQVSYNKKFDAWAISSKNVCMFVKSSKDINEDEQRYSFSRLIAKVWFAYIKKLEENSPQLLAELKEYLNGKTLVGEYCGNQDYQHLVKYDKIDLHFYAIVENQSRETCIPLDEAYKMFDKFQLTKVEISKFTVHNWKEFNTEVFRLYKEVGSSSIEKDGEGAVLYFVREQRDTKEQQVISLCKLKTLDYRIFRKLREKLKNCLADKAGSGSKWFKRFEKEVIELCEFCEPAHELNYYNTIAKAAFDFVESSLSIKHRSMISSRYITFLDMIKKSIDEKVTVNMKYLKQYLEENPIQEGEGDGDGDGEEVVNKQLDPSLLMNNIRIIVVSPPFYINEKLQKNICEALNIKSIGNNWREGHSNVELVSLDNIHIPPRITSQKLNKFNLFIFAGFTDKRLALLKHQIDDLKISGETDEEKAYTKSNSLKKIFTQNTQKIKDIKQSAKTFLPNNSVFLDDVFKYSDDNKSLINEEEDNSTFLQKILQEFKKLTYQITNAKAQKMKISDDETQDVEDEEKKQNNDNDEMTEQNEDKDKSSNKKNKTQEKSHKKNVLIILPITIPATGKSTFFNKVIEEFEKEHSDIKTYYVSSDIIRQQIMEEIKQRNPQNQLSHDDLFNKSSKTAKSRFDAVLSEKIDCIADEDEKCLNHLIILDKNHPPSAITSTIPFIQESMPKTLNYKIVAVTPKVYDTYTTERYSYPFSLTYLLNCMDRALNRETHETLIGDPLKIVGVIFMFFNLFKNIKFNGIQLQKLGFQKHIEITFHKEDKNSDSEIHNKLTKKLDQLLKSIRPQDDLASSPIIPELLEAFYQSNMKFEHVDYSVQKGEFTNKVLEIFNSFK